MLLETKQSVHNITCMEIIKLVLTSLLCTGVLSPLSGRQPGEPRALPLSGARHHDGQPGAHTGSAQHLDILRSVIISNNLKISGGTRLPSVTTLLPVSTVYSVSRQETDQVKIYFFHIFFHYFSVSR